MTFSEAFTTQRRFFYNEEQQTIRLCPERYAIARFDSIRWTSCQDDESPISSDEIDAALQVITDFGDGHQLAEYLEHYFYGCTETV